MAYQCSLDGFMLQEVVSWDGLHYFYDYPSINGPFDISLDGHMVYEYSFLVELDILCPLVRLVFSLGTSTACYG